MEILIENGADLRAQAADGGMPIHSASARGHLDIVRILLAHNMSVNERDAEGVMPLQQAAIGGQLDVAKYLISQGADVFAASYSLNRC